jgi:hypothetical protein
LYQLLTPHGGRNDPLLALSREAQRKGTKGATKGACYMKKVTITLEFEGENAEYIAEKEGGVDVGLLLRDALADFRCARQTPTVEAYVATRYGWPFTDFHRAKAHDVKKRIAFSEVLGKAIVTINVSDRAEEIGQILRNCPNCKKTMEVHDFTEVAPCAKHQLLALKLQEMLPELKLKEVMKSVRQCRSVWVPGVLRSPWPTRPEAKTRCTLPDGHIGRHSWEPEPGECPEGGAHVFTPDEEYDGGQTINCEKCGALQPEEE